MESKDYIDLPEASHEAVHAARDAAQAVELARQLQTDKAAEAAANKITQNMGDILQTRLEHVLARGTEQEKAIILARVPYICQDIKGINEALQNIVKMMEQVKKDLDAKDEKNAREISEKYVSKDQFSPYKWALVTIATVVVTTLAGAFLAQIVIPK